MTKDEAIKTMYQKRTPSQWLEFEKEFYETLTTKERNDIGGMAMNMTEICGYIRLMEKKRKFLNPNTLL